MNLFDKEKVKENSKYLVILILIALVLIIFEYIQSPKEKKTIELSDDEISFNSLVINEVMSSNDGAYVDELGNSYDWIEIYNGTNEDIDLSDYGLSDETSGKTKWLFPNVTIKSKEYLIVYLSGESKEGLVANFALNRNGGETITLKSSNGKVIDSIKTLSLEKNSVMARDINGNWFETNEITPGYSNNKEGRDNYLKSLKGDTSSLIISEFLPSNEGNILFDSHMYEYIELENTTESDILLSEYYLSNDEERPFLWKLPNVTLKAGDVYLIYASDLGTENHTNFNIKNRNGTLILSKKNKIVDSITYSDLENGFAYVRVNGKFISSIDISPGYLNTTKDVEKFNKDKRKNPDDLIINEVMNSNNQYLAQNGGEYYDWIELYNNTDHTINLSEYALTTNQSSKKYYVLPDVELKSHEYYVVMASGNIDYSNSSYKHTNFKLSQVEGLYLYKDETLIDSMFIANIPNGYSYGKGNESGLYYFSKPTPKKDNSDDGVLEIAYAPEFSVKPGVYNDKSTITLKMEGLGTIYYTLDGSEPNKNSKVYDSPIILKETTVVRAISYEDDKKASSVVTGSYIINEEHTLPVMSLSLPDSSFKLISNNPNSTKLTVAAHAELYEDGKSFSIDCGMKLFGGQTRFISKKSFALKFSSVYGPSKLEYKVFDNRDAVRYDTLVVRSGSQDSSGSMFRDELATSIMDDYGTVDVQAYKAVILYINGNYWGIYFLREKVDSEFVRHHYNVDEEGTNIVRIDNDISEGSSSFYNSVVNYVRNHDMTSNEAYEYVSSKIDIDNFIDYWIGALYTTNNDIVNTRFFNNPNVDNGKIKMIFYDFDYAFYNYSRNYMSWMTNPEGMGEHNYDNTLLRGLLKNKKFRKRFLERASYNMNNVWSDENVTKRYNELYNLLKPEMEREQKRWNRSYSYWEKECEILKDYIEKRREFLLKSIKNYFGLSSEEMKEYFD